MRTRWTGPALVIDTPAKLNLHLQVLGRRTDGYHELETVMVSIGLFDTLVIEPGTAEIELTCVGAESELPADSSNLVMRAAEVLRSATGCRGGAKIALSKRIPMQAGMGGGSSDAAAALVGLNQFWQLGLSSEELHPLAAQLGSDVNFFLDSASLAVCRGRGEAVTAAPLRGPLWFVIAKPKGGLSTAAVFRQLAPSELRHGDCSSILAGCAQGDLASIGGMLRNDLEAPSRALSQDVSGLLDQMHRLALAGSRMTGSGSACFGLAANRDQALRAGRRLKQQGVSEVFVVRTAV
jgi:4-diphosphocytidyl-2-C-methyl-D-erythritol kinase